MCDFVLSHVLFEYHFGALFVLVESSLEALVYERLDNFYLS